MACGSWQDFKIEKAVYGDESASNLVQEVADLIAASILC